MQQANGPAWRSFETPLGVMVAAATPRGVCLLEFEDRRALARERAEVASRSAGETGGGEWLELLAAELRGYFSGDLRAFTAPIDPFGTAFERAVWDRLRAIPYGATRSYGSIAAELGRPGGARAVGRANGRNRIAIVVPCHRVVEEGGGLGGYGGGLDRKEFLLGLERGQAGGLWSGVEASRTAALISARCE